MSGERREKRDKNQDASLQESRIKTAFATRVKIASLLESRLLVLFGTRTKTLRYKSQELRPLSLLESRSLRFWSLDCLCFLGQEPRRFATRVKN